MSYELLPTAQIDQGDIIRHVLLVKKSPGQEDSPIEHYYTPVFVLSNGCDIDKPFKQEYQNDTVLVAAVFRLANLPAAYQGEFRKRKVVNAWYLPKDDPLPEDCYIDWRTVQPVDKATLLSARSSNYYLCTIRGELLESISEHFWEFFFRQRPRNSPAPSE